MYEINFPDWKWSDDEGYSVNPILSVNMYRFRFGLKSPQLSSMDMASYPLGWNCTCQQSNYNFTVSSS